MKIIKKCFFFQHKTQTLLIPKKFKVMFRFKEISLEKGEMRKLFILLEVTN